ncbi:MAG TPA: hypothetical protein VMG35_15705 [Bryobacteraceae bacterium]|nr:hypothetical protein [Bryobacteraceae bacterium]
MPALSNSELLRLWEAGYGLHPLDQSLLALRAALPGATYDALADWPLGRRNRALAELYAASFGSSLRGWVSCAECRERLEFEMDLGACAATLQSEESIVVRGRAFRLPTTRDLARAAQEADPRAGVARLIEGCRLDAETSENLQEADLEDVEQQMARADPLAEISLDLSCSACGHGWSETLDLALFLWAQIQARAKRLIREVHTLASAYRWSEEHILSMSEARRAAYLELVEE